MNKKSLKKYCLIANLIAGISISSFFSTTCCFSLSSNLVQASINNTITNDVAPASDFFTTISGTVEGNIFYTVSNQQVTITSSANLVINNASLNSKFGEYDIVAIGSKAFFTSSGISGSLNFPSTLVSIGNNAFYSCKKIESISFSGCSELQTIGELSFAYCDLISSVNLCGCTNLTSINQHAFDNCCSITALDFSDCVNLQKIDKFSFRHCQGIGYINFSNCHSLQTIGVEAFADCDSLEILDLSQTNVKTIENLAFEQSNSIKTVFFPSSIETINGYAFYNCHNITSLDLQNTIITNINNNAFSNCTSLSSILLPSTIKTIGSGCFSNISQNATIYVPFDNMIENTSLWNETSYTDIGLSKNVPLKSNPNIIDVFSDNNLEATGNCSVTLSNWGSTSGELKHNSAILTSIGDTTLTDCDYLTISNKKGIISAIESNAFANSDQSIKIVKLSKDIGDMIISANTFENSNIQEFDVSDWNASDLLSLINQGQISKDWLGNKNNVDTIILVNKNEMSEFKEKADDLGIGNCEIIGINPPKDSNLALILGISLGIGIPSILCVASLSIRAIYIRKKRKN